MSFKKVYVEVQLRVKADGSVRPISILWEDGIVYTVDRLRKVVPAASLKVGGGGMRYTVVIEGKDRYLFEENGKWFVEGRCCN
jgi:hypothetical protein